MKKNPSVEITTRAAQALQSGVSPSMLHRHLGVTPTYADRREATVRPSGRAVTVYEFGLPRGPHAALAVVTGQRAGEYEVFLARSGERELPVAGGKVALSGSVAARRNPRMKYIDELAESMVNQEVAAIKAQGPASAACLSEHGAWGHVYNVLTYLYGHEMESIARRFTAGVISGDLGAVHLDDRILGKPAVGRNMQNKVSGAQAARAFRALRELCASKRTCAACKGSGQLRGQTCSWCGGTGGGARTNPRVKRYKTVQEMRRSGVPDLIPGSSTLIYESGRTAPLRGHAGHFISGPSPGGRSTALIHRRPAEFEDDTEVRVHGLYDHWGDRRRNSGMAPLGGDMGFGGPGAPSMFNNMSDVLQGNVPRRNRRRRNLGDGPPPPPPVGNPHGWETLTLDNAYDNAPLRSKDHPEWGEKRLRYEGSEGRGYWTHWSNHGSAVLPEGEFRFWEIKGGSEGSRGKGYAHRYPRVRTNPRRVRANHHLHPGDRVSMGAFIGTVDQQLPGTYDTYRVQWDRGGIDRVEGHKLRKL